VHRPADDPGPAQRWRVPRAVSAVTGAFLATRRTDFDAVGGFDGVHMAVSCSDFDYALKLRAHGLRILWTPAISLIHSESKTRGLDHIEPSKAARDAAERAALRARWGEALDREPGVNPFWRSAALPHQFIAFPSQTRIQAYIAQSASANPWAVSPPKAL
jgi:GT2 family glycosyltransferase